MSAHEIIERVQQVGIRLAARDGKLVIDAPRGAITADLRAMLVEHKDELLRLLAANDRPTPKVWSCRVDGADFVVIDPARGPDETMLAALRDRFGHRFEQARRVR